jgi:hypothetical protein
MEAVLVPFEEYEYLSKLEDIFEYFEIDEMIQARLNTYDPINNVAWKTEYRNNRNLGNWKKRKRRNIQENRKTNTNEIRK